MTGWRIRNIKEGERRSELERKRNEGKTFF